MRKLRPILEILCWTIEEDILTIEANLVLEMTIVDRASGTNAEIDIEVIALSEHCANI